MRQLLWINGQSVDCKNTYTLSSPYDGNPIAEVALATEEDVLLAIDAAYKIRKSMGALSAHKRAEILENVVAILKEEREICARIISEEAAKPIKAARMEVERTIMTYQFAAGEARRIYGETIPMDAAPGGEGRIAYTVREPIGVIAAITPFNFPMNLVAHKIGPAIAAGNTVVLKPASQTPLSAYKIAEIFDRAGLPKGALNVITGSGKSIGDVLTTDHRIAMVTFTGSPKVGASIRARAGLKKVTLELGSNSAVIVDRTADLEKIIPRLVAGAFSYQGQVCISVQRLYVHEEIYEKFVSRFIEETKKLTLGDPLSEETDVSALISSSDLARIQEWIKSAVANGATLAYGGDIIGNTLTPGVLLHVPPTENISCEEAFAPVVHINSYSNFQEAIDFVNESEYGLQAGVYTSNIHLAFQAARELHVGGVMINDFSTFRLDHMPYGGVKQSGTGREGIKYAIEEMMELKLVSINLN